MSDPSPEVQLAAFIEKYSPEIAGQARVILAKMRDRLPGAVELVYDNYNALAIGFSPTDRLSDTVFSVTLFPRWVSLFFFKGVDLPDPERLLQGKGNAVRHIVLQQPEMLDSPPIRALMDAALQQARSPLDPRQPHRIVIKSVSANQRPRRPANKSGG